VASPAKAKHGALFLNCQEEIIFKHTLEDLGHPQPKIPIHCNNTTAIRIGSNTIKNKDCEPWTLDIFGLGTMIHKMYISWVGTPDRKIWSIIKVSITPVHITPQYNHIINKRKFSPWNIWLQ
jgi:hypothetical protein